VEDRESGTQLAIGLMSGTSADGIDGVAVLLQDGVGKRGVTVVAAHRIPYRPDLREAVLAACAGAATTVELCRLHAALGEALADTAVAVLAAARAAGEDRPLSFVASHGQTVWHEPPGAQLDAIYLLPRGALAVPGTLQLGEGARIAERLRVPVVCDFRQQDLASGGQGAPLTPFADHLLYTHPHESRAIQNLGGIGNVTFLPAGASREEVIAFDTGPGNAIMDAAAALATSGAQQYDRDGVLAASATPDPALVSGLLAELEPYLAQPPPKSTGRELVGAAVARRLHERGIDGGLLLSVATQFTVETIADQYARWLPRPDRVALCGGGARNPELVRRLRTRLSPVPVCTLAELGADPDLREAVAFAVLGYHTLRGEPTGMPRVTGAARSTVQGKVCRP
jgi:anhydro-N-acetylmuramic acid kinase